MNPDSLKIISWNINSIRVRLPLLTELLKEHEPQIVLLQEIKCVIEQFPREELEDLGYQMLILGQKSYHGVAILYKGSTEDVIYNIPGFDGTDARYIEAMICGVRISNLYVYNGFDMNSESYANKLLFLDALSKITQEKVLDEVPWILAGDFNIIPRALDTYDKSPRWEETGVASPAIRKLWRKIIDQGWLDAGENEGMTWRDYKHKNVELRIDHMLLSPSAADMLVNIKVLKEWRDKIRPSDHMPLLLSMNRRAENYNLL